MSIALEDLKTRVHQKIGRNVLLFQKIEILLKFLVTRGKFSGYPSELQEKYKSVENKTLGHLINQFLGCSDFLKSENEPDLYKELWISVDVAFETDINTYKERKFLLKLLVGERNQLIHHFLEDERWDLTTVEGWNLAEIHLDEQYKKIQKEFQLLKVETELVQELVQESLRDLYFNLRRSLHNSEDEKMTNKENNLKG